MLSAGALIPLTLRVDRRLDEVVAVGLLFFLALSVNGEATRLQDVEGPAETFQLSNLHGPGSFGIC